MLLYTSNFANAGKNPNAVCISRGAPRGWSGRRYTKLAPTWAMLKMSDEDYLREYDLILAKLDPHQVLEELGDGAIMLCWEPFNVRCHRRYVAEWLERHCQIIIPEYGHERVESLPFSEQPNKEPKPNKGTLLSGLLFTL